MKPPAAQSAHAQPAEPTLVQIEKPIYGGAFLARVEGKAVFVPLALPGEQARVRFQQEKRGYATAEISEITAAAPERITPACRHFGACGGCAYQHANYPAQLAFKQAILRETLERGGVHPPEEIRILSADPWHYRNRIRLAFDAHGNAGYRGRRSHAVIPIAECPIAAPLLVEAAQAAATLTRKFTPAFRPTEISLFCDPTETSLLITLFATSSARNRFQEFAKALASRVPALAGAELAIEGRNSEPPRTIATWDATSLPYRAADFDYRVDHGAFFQVNRWLTDALVNAVVDRVNKTQSNALAWDLFAGVGLFARRLTANFDHVVAVESAPAATAALAHNLCATSATTVHAETRAFLRRNLHGPQSNLVAPDLIVMDPPRTGLGAEVCAMLAQIAAPALVYVSCDPATLVRDLRALLASGYAVQSITLADLFPQTFHLETVVHLQRS